MATVLITGCSSGFGLETARLFLDRGWTVVATMRTPREDLLPASDRLRILPLDVTDADSIARAVEAAGPIDVLVNNAGIGWLNAAEATPIGMVRDIFEANTLGTIAMVHAVLPQFRARGAGVIVNVTSTVTMATFPLLSAYTASKVAVNAFSEALALETAQIGVRTHIVLPGRAPDTRFADNARGHTGADTAIPEAYAPLAAQMFAMFADADAPVTRADDVAEAVWRAATDPAAPLRLPAGADALALAAAA